MNMSKVWVSSKGPQLTLDCGVSKVEAEKEITTKMNRLAMVDRDRYEARGAEGLSERCGAGAKLDGHGCPRHRKGHASKREALSHSLLSHWSCDDLLLLGRGFI